MPVDASGREASTQSVLHAVLCSPPPCGEGSAPSSRQRLRLPHEPRLQLLMTAVAHRAVGGALAGAEPGLLGLVGLPFDWAEFAALVRAVAERLLLRAPAGAPPVALA